MELSTHPGVFRALENVPELLDRIFTLLNAVDSASLACALACSAQFRPLLQRLEPVTFADILLLSEHSDDV